MTRRCRCYIAGYGSRHSFVVRHWAFVILVAALDVGTTLAEKRKITEKDLFDFVWIGDPQVSPDGSRVAFVRITVNEKKDGYNTSIWAVPISGSEAPYRLTKGDHDTAPRWSPDGKNLVFLRATDKNGKSDTPQARSESRAPVAAQLAMLPMAGGDSFSFTDLPRGASNPVWSPDGRSIAFISDVNADDLAKQEKKKRKQEEAKKTAAQNAPTASPVPTKTPAAPSSNDAKTTEADSEHESDVRMITRAVYREDNEGYDDPKHPQHIWIVPPPHTADEKVQPKELTFGRFDEGTIVWAKDSSRIYFTSLRVDEPYYELSKTELYMIDRNGGAPTKLNSIDMQVDNLSLSPDGKQLAFVASRTQPITSYSQPDLWIVDLTPNAKPRNLTANFDFDVGQGVFGDNAPPRGGGKNVPIWSRDGREITELCGKQGRTLLAAFDVQTGAEADLTKGDEAVLQFRASNDGAKLVYTISTPTRITDLFVSERTGGMRRQLSHLNDELFSKLNLTAPEEISYKSFDGKIIHAWVQKPPSVDPTKKYPLILNIHGGPHAAYGYIFEHEFQWMAAKGYVVLYPNPRGSTTYGQDFGNVIQYHYPGDDYKDLMAGVDEVLRRGYIDKAKLGVTGGSGGGLLTNWVVGQTNRFAAAVAQRDIANWSHWWYTADFTLFQPNWFRAPPFDDEQDFTARSPIAYIKNVTTPMMFIVGENDFRTPPGAGGEEMFRALKFRKIPTVMVRFPNESHELSRSGQPWHRVERLQHIVGWFDHWLMGAPKPEYEVTPQEQVPPRAKVTPGEETTPPTR